MMDVPTWLMLNYDVAEPTQAQIRSAIYSENPGVDQMRMLLHPSAAPFLEEMAGRALSMTRRHFGRTVSLYVPLYLSNYCSSGCAYCGFASDRKVPRSKLTEAQMREELQALRTLNLDEILLLTGERTPQADYEYLRDAVTAAAEHFALVSIEAFPMSEAEYKGLVEAGCTGVTLYQETYDAVRYDDLHRWGPKKDYAARMDAPERALKAGMRTVGLGALLGLSEPVQEMTALYLHARHLLKKYWRCGVTISFPRLRNQAGGFEAAYDVSDRMLAQFIYAFRICLPDVPLVLSTREAAAFRDGMAGVGISKMSVASKTTVGGYSDSPHGDAESGQFDVSDQRSVDEFCAMLHARHLEPVFKNWDAVYR